MRNLGFSQNVVITQSRIWDKYKIVAQTLCRIGKSDTGIATILGLTRKIITDLGLTWNVAIDIMCNMR